MKTLVQALVIGMLGVGLANADSYKKRDRGITHYIGAGIGQGRSNIEEIYPLDDKDTAWTVFYGLDFTPNFAAEVSYNGLGKYTFTTLGSSFEYKSFGLAGLMKGNLGSRAQSFLKLGVHRWDTDYTGDAWASWVEDEDGVDLFIGVGLDFNINKNFTARLEYARFKFDQSVVEGEANVDRLTANLIYKF